MKERVADTRTAGPGAGGPQTPGGGRHPPQGQPAGRGPRPAPVDPDRGPAQGHPRRGPRPDPQGRGPGRRRPAARRLAPRPRREAPRGRPQGVEGPAGRGPRSPRPRPPTPPGPGSKPWPRPTPRRRPRPGSPWRCRAGSSGADVGGRQPRRPPTTSGRPATIVRDYLASRTDAARATLLADLQKVEGLDLDAVARLVARMDPPLRDPDPSKEKPGVRDDPPGRRRRQPGPVRVRRAPPARIPPARGATRPSSPSTTAGARGRRPSGSPPRPPAGATSSIAPEYNVPGQGKAYHYSTGEHAAAELSLRDARKRYSIDSDRVYLAGQLEGANMAWDFGLAHPDLFAGVVAHLRLPGQVRLQVQAPGRPPPALHRPGRAGPGGPRGRLRPVRQADDPRRPGRDLRRLPQARPGGAARGGPRLLRLDGPAPARPRPQVLRGRHRPRRRRPLLRRDRPRASPPAGPPPPRPPTRSARTSSPPRSRCGPASRAT